MTGFNYLLHRNTAIQLPSSLKHCNSFGCTSSNIDSMCLVIASDSANAEILGISFAHHSCRACSSKAIPTINWSSFQSWNQHYYYYELTAHIYTLNWLLTYFVFLIQGNLHTTSLTAGDSSSTHLLRFGKVFFITLFTTLLFLVSSAAVSTSSSYSKSMFYTKKL